MDQDFDYIIVGAGSAGCALANRLSREASHRVLLLEAGPPDRHPMIHVPLGFAFLMKHPQLNWCYQTEAEATMNDRRIDWPRGKVLGGSSSINGMVYIRGQQRDYDGWAAAGNPGWSYAEVLPYFKRSEHNSRGSSDYHGIGGPLWVEDFSQKYELAELFVQAAIDCGIPPNDDFNGASQEGAGFYQVNIKNGLRYSSARSYLKPARKRPNLTLITNALTTRITFDGKRASGIHYQLQGQHYSARARRQIILCAGAINTPQLLELSGIGNPTILSKQGIDVVKALPGVGENLQDHLTINVIYRLKNISTFYEESKPLAFLRNLANFLTRRTGLLAHPASQAGVFFRLSEDSDSPDAQIHFAPAAGEYNDKGTMDTVPGTTATVCYLQPESRGSVHISSANPLQAPAIRANYLNSDRDCKASIQAVRRTREIFASRIFDHYRVAELEPGAACDSDDELLDFIRNNGNSVYHPVGSCKMGSDDDAVVDAELRVYGIDGLRIADASIMPRIPSGNTHASCVMIAEKAADMILADERERSDRQRQTQTR